jgi:hypothetical protein
VLIPLPFAFCCHFHAHRRCHHWFTAATVVVFSQYIIFTAAKIHYYFLSEGSPKTQKPLKHNLNSMTADESRLTLRNNLKSPTKYRELEAYRKFCTSTTYLKESFKILHTE